MFFSYLANCEASEQVAIWSDIVCWGTPNPFLILSRGYAEAVHADVSHRFLLLLTDKTMIDKLRKWRNRWVSKPVPSWLPNTSRVGPFLGGGRVHSFPGGGSGRQKASRNTTIIRLSCLACPPSFWRGWSQEKIAEVVGLSRNRASEIVGNTNFSEIDTLLSQGYDMEYIAGIITWTFHFMPFLPQYLTTTGFYLKQNGK